jgi:hypothetical protein
VTLRKASIDALLAECRSFQAAALRVMFDPRLDTSRRQVAMQRLLDRARRAQAPEFAAHAVERAAFDVIFGRDRECGFRERWLEEAVRRDAARGAA